MNSTSPMPDYSGYDGTGIIVCASVFIVAQTLVVGVRLYAKYLTKSSWGWDDYMLLPALFFANVLDGLYISTVLDGGVGQHIEQVLMTDPNKLVALQKITIAIPVFTAMCLTFPRLSTYSTYLRIFTSRILRNITWWAIGVSVVYAIFSIILTLTVCVPLEALWTPGLEAHCFDRAAWWAYSTIPYVTLDVITMALPVSTIMNLSIPLSERVALLLTFLAYGFGTIAGTTRIVIFARNSAQVDLTWTGVASNLSAICEVGSYVIAACIPGLRSLYLYTAGKGSYSHGGSNTRESGARPLRYELDSRRTLPSSGSVTNSGRTKDSHYQSEESLVGNRIKVTNDITVARS